MIVCDESSILPFSCEQEGLAHVPEFWRMERDLHSGRFTDTIYLCDRCDHRMKVA